LLKKIKERKEANSELIEKIQRLQARQNETISKYNRLSKDLESVMSSHATEIETTRQRFQQLQADIESTIATAARDKTVIQAEQEKLTASVHELGCNSSRAVEQLEVRLEEQMASDRCRNKADFEGIAEALHIAEERLEDQQVNLASNKAAIAELAKGIGQLEEGWTAFQREIDRRCCEQANQQHAIYNDLVNRRQQLAAKLEGLKLSLTYVEEEMTGRKANSLEFGRQVADFQRALSCIEESLGVQVEQLDSRLAMAVSQQERLAVNFSTAKGNYEMAHSQQSTTLTTLVKEVDSMKQTLEDIAENVRRKGAAEQSHQTGKICELDTLMANQLAAEAKIRETEETLRSLEDTVSRVYQDHLEQIINLNEEHGKLSGSLTEKWGSLDMKNVSMKNDLKMEIDEKRTELDKLILAANVSNNQRFAELESALQRTATSLTGQIRQLEADLAANTTEIDTKLVDQVAAVNESLVQLRRDEVAVAVQTVRSFRTRIMDLERRVTEIDHVMEEYPREWKNSLLFHGLEQKDGETFFSLAGTVSKIIRLKRKSVSS
jgi:chromosome segregation ATPase